MVGHVVYQESPRTLLAIDKGFRATPPACPTLELAIHDPTMGRTKVSRRGGVAVLTST
jgi:hypothetical protein